MRYKKLIWLSILWNMSCIYGMSHTKTIMPILAALQTAEKTFLGEKSWNVVNDLQKLLINRYIFHTGDLEKLLPNELTLCVSRDTSIVNQFLKENKVTIQLKPCTHSGFAIASIMTIVCTWKITGEKTKVLYQEKPYPGVLMNNNEHNIQYTIKKLAIYPNPIVHLATNSGDTVSMTIADQERRGFDLLRLIEALIEKGDKEDGQTCSNITHKYESVRFPMVDLNHYPDISWLIGMSKCTPQDCEYAIEQALQQTKFQMDERGVQMHSAAAEQFVLTTMPMHMKQPLLIDKPFFVWITRPGMKLPLFTSYVQPDDWQDPKEQ